jgi:hypothetical protein
MVKGIRQVYPLNHVPFAQSEAIDLLAENYDYRTYGEKHHESRYTKFIQSYYLFEKFGIDYRRATLSSQICSGQIDRDHAIEALMAEPYDMDEVKVEKIYIAKKLGISLDELENIIKLPPRFYWDYPNDDVKLGYIYTVFRKLFHREKLASV